MKRRVEAGDLRQTRTKRAHDADQSEILRLMKRREWDQPFQSGKQSIRDHGRFGMNSSAVNNAMSTRGQRLAGDPFVNPFQQVVNGGFMIEGFAIGPLLLEDRCT